MSRGDRARSYWVTGVRSCLLFGVALVSRGTQAQVLQQDLQQRCVADDHLNAEEAEARLNWARKCAIRNHVALSSFRREVIDTGALDANGKPLLDYNEPMPLSWNMDIYSDPSEYGAANATVRKYLYLQGPTYEFKDRNGWWAWGKLPTLKKRRPLYPTYGSEPDIYSSTNVRLFPHPQLVDCNLYYDRTGKSRADHFFNNGYCVSACPELRGEPFDPWAGWKARLEPLSSWNESKQTQRWAHIEAAVEGEVHLIAETRRETCQDLVPAAREPVLKDSRIQIGQTAWYIADVPHFK